MICHQYLIRAQAAPEPNEDVKRELARDFSRASVREIDYETAQPLVMRYEWLQTMSGRWFVGLYFGEFLAGVEAFGFTAGTRVAESVAGIENAHRVCELVRGLCLPWAHPHSASWFIPRACRLMAEKYGKNFFVMYADQRGGEIGTIYSAINAIYTGRTQPAQQFRTPDGRTHDARQVSGLARDRRGGTLKYRHSRQTQKLLLLEEGAEFVPGTAKHRFVLISGSPTVRKRLRKALKWPSLQHPKRAMEQPARVGS